MIRHHQMSAITDEEIFIDFDASLFQTLDLHNKGYRVNDDPVSYDADLPLPENSRGYQMEDIFFVTIDDGVTRIVSTLASNDNIDVSRQHIDDFAFAFVTPLGTYKNSIGHVFYAKKAGLSPAEWIKIAS